MKVGVFASYDNFQISHVSTKTLKGTSVKATFKWRRNLLRALATPFYSIILRGVTI